MRIVVPGASEEHLVFYHPQKWDLWLILVGGPDGLRERPEPPSDWRFLYPRCIWHSPEGYSWGYAGSGPADLALSICDHLIPPGMDGLKPERVWEGWASPTAIMCHQVVKNEFLVGVGRTGGRIEGSKLLRCVKGLLPKQMEWCRDHWERFAEVVSDDLG